MKGQDLYDLLDEQDRQADKIGKRFGHIILSILILHAIVFIVAIFLPKSNMRDVMLVASFVPLSVGFIVGLIAMFDAL